MREETWARSSSRVGTVALFVVFLSSLLYSHSPKAHVGEIPGFLKPTFHQPTAGKFLTAGWLYVLCKSSWNRNASPSVCHFFLDRRRTLRSSSGDWKRELFRKQTKSRAAPQCWVVLKPEVVCGYNQGGSGNRWVAQHMGLLTEVFHNFQMFHTSALYPGLALDLKGLLLWS